jgi:SAM-dependent methyltransferase
VGRVLRHFAPDAGKAQFYGCDIDEASVEWMNNHLNPLFKVIRNDAFPRLPYPSNHFDIIYALSVFTHLTQNWAEWLEEIRRILSPEGLFIATFHSRAAYEYTLNRRYNEKAVGMETYFEDRSWDLGGPQVFHSSWWVIDNWGKILPVQYVVREGMANWQSIAVMRKLEPTSSRSRIDIPCLQPFTYVPRRSDFFGNIDYDPLASSSWLSEHGFLYEENAEVRGWFCSSVGPIEEITFYVDGRPVPPSQTIRKSRPDIFQTYPNTPYSLESGFEALLCLGKTSPGPHLTVVAARDKAGRELSVELTLYRKEKVQC